MEKFRFWVAAGDRRQDVIAACLTAEGHRHTALEEADVLVLPTPLSAEKHGLEGILRRTKDGAVAFAGHVQPDAYAIAGAAGRLLIDCLLREELAWYNAVATAEGAVGLLLAQREETLFGSRVAVLGYGRIGKLLAHRLLAFGAEVWVVARRPEIRAEAQGMGCHTAGFDTLNQVLAGTQVVVNTVPGKVMGEDALEALPMGAAVFDLASAPGGVDFDAARRMGVEAALYPALPALCAPAAAGRFVAMAILRTLEEREGEPV